MVQSPERNESSTERADRNWTELTQELRVSQTGVQILTAFLLILPFQQRFAGLSAGQYALYLVLVSLSIITTILMVAPVTLHRFLFGRGRKAEVVRISNGITVAALLFLGLTIIGAVAFVFSVVASGPLPWIAAIVTALLILGLWLVLPWRARVASDPWAANE